MDSDPDALSIEQFCSRNGISRGAVYKLWQRGLGPRFMQVGTRRLISREAAADWRQAMEKAALERPAA